MTLRNAVCTQLLDRFGAIMLFRMHGALSFFIKRRAVVERKCQCTARFDSRSQEAPSCGFYAQSAFDHALFIFVCRMRSDEDLVREADEPPDTFMSTAAFPRVFVCRRDRVPQAPAATPQSIHEAARARTQSAHRSSQGRRRQDNRRVEVVQVRTSKYRPVVAILRRCRRVPVMRVVGNGVKQTTVVVDACGDSVRNTVTTCMVALCGSQ